MPLVVDDDLAFDEATGSLRLIDAVKPQLVFRITPEGIGVWNKTKHEEQIIPWMKFLKLAVTVVCENSSEQSQHLSQR